MYALKREFIYGWDFTEYDDNGMVITYNTAAEANKALQDYIDDVNDAHAKGDLDHPYENDCKVMKTSHGEIAKAIEQDEKELNNDIKAKNRLIVQFMGFYAKGGCLYSADGTKVHKLRYWNDNTALEAFIKEASYHSSWDWLIPVVRKIFEISSQNEPDGDELSLIIRDALTDLSLRGCYDAVIDYIIEHKDSKTK